MIIKTPQRDKDTENHADITAISCNPVINLIYLFFNINTLKNINLCDIKISVRVTCFLIIHQPFDSFK